jgi:PAS domain S-box-containing protein
MFPSETLTEPVEPAKLQNDPSKRTRILALLSSRLHGYIPALGAFVLAMVLHSLAVALFGSKLPGTVPFFLYLLAFLTASWCGYGPGVVVTLLITCAMPYLFKPNFSLRTVDVGGVVIFLLLSAIVSGLSSSRRRSEALLRRMNQDLDLRVREQTTVLRDQLAELEALYAKLPVGICFLDTRLCFVRVNDRMASIHGLPVEAHFGRSVRDMVSERFADIVEPLYQSALYAEEPILDHELAGPATGTGAGRFWLISCSPVRVEGHILGLQVVLQDITDRKQADEDLRRSNTRLRRANDDLEQFAFSAAHDLQEPLRSVAIYSQMLQRKFGGLLGVEGDEYIGYTLRGALRMQQLVNDLLAYTQASFADGSLAELISANEALAQALQNLHTGVADARASITFSDLPAVHMRKVHLVQLFQNLIGNSIKYRGGEPLRIHISATRQGDDWLFSVTDNGIGIDPQYQQQVFGVFKRLHSPQEYPGTGIGLAICRRILEQHGGKIWVDSKFGEGATFLFTLPVTSGTTKGHHSA